MPFELGGIPVRRGYPPRGPVVAGNDVIDRVRCPDATGSGKAPTFLVWGYRFGSDARSGSLPSTLSTTPTSLPRRCLPSARRLTRCRAQSGRTNAGEAHMDESRAARVQQVLGTARATLARSRGEQFRDAEPLGVPEWRSRERPLSSRGRTPAAPAAPAPAPQLDTSVPSWEEDRARFSMRSAACASCVKRCMSGLLKSRSGRGMRRITQWQNGPTRSALALKKRAKSESKSR